LGRVTIIFDPETSVLMDIKVTFIFETMPIELFSIDAVAEFIADIDAETVMVRLSVWKYVLPT
jgi:hypothetical protein